MQDSVESAIGIRPWLEVSCSFLGRFSPNLCNFSFYDMVFPRHHKGCGQRIDLEAIASQPTPRDRKQNQKVL
jgi:hypothetical protein